MKSINEKVFDEHNDIDGDDMMPNESVNSSNTAPEDEVLRQIRLLFPTIKHVLDLFEPIYQVIEFEFQKSEEDYFKEAADIVRNFLRAQSFRFSSSQDEKNFYDNLEWLEENCWDKHFHSANDLAYFL